jgi:hypothetical protein
VLRLQREDPSRIDWAHIDSLPERSIFQTRAWLNFLVETQDGEPVVARVLDGSQTVGWFTGLVVRRFGVRILGSPFQGWTTASMGFSLDPGVSRREATDALLRFAFNELGCMHVEMLDRRMCFDDLPRQRESVDEFLTYEVDLRPDESDIFANMSSAARRAVRKSEKNGVRVEHASGVDFADTYYAQLEDVFAKQSLRPPYSVERVRQMIYFLEPTGALMLLRAVGPHHPKPIATAIFLVFNGIACFWGGASWRNEQILRPNEAIFWHAIREAKERGVETLDLGGGGDYKRKYGVNEVKVPFVRESRVPGLMKLRNAARYVYWRTATRSWFKRKAKRPER